MSKIFIVLGIILLALGFIVPLVFAILHMINVNNMWIFFATSITLFVAGAVSLKKGVEEQ